MKGYAYLDLDGDLVYKVASYIDNINPGFFSQNRQLIVRHWTFNTEEIPSMLKMFRDIEDLRIPSNRVGEFIKSIGFDMSKLKNANKV